MILASPNMSSLEQRDDDQTSDTRMPMNARESRVGRTGKTNQAASGKHPVLELRTTARCALGAGPERAQPLLVVGSVAVEHRERVYRRRWRHEPGMRQRRSP